MIKLPLQISVTPEDTAAVSKIEQTARETIEHIATTPLEELIPELMREAVNFGIKVLAAFLIYIIGAWLIKKIRNMLHRIFEKRKTEKAISSFVESLTSISLTIILIIITVGALGVNTTSLAALLAAGGMAIGMALSGTVQNFAGGIMILVFKPFKAGDFIETENGYSGTVSDVNIFSTKLTTTDNRLIIIPNGSLSNGTINNYSQNKMRRVEWLVGVEYGTAAKDVKAQLLPEQDATRGMACRSGIRHGCKRCQGRTAGNRGFGEKGAVHIHRSACRPSHCCECAQGQRSGIRGQSLGQVRGLLGCLLHPQ